MNSEILKIRFWKFDIYKRRFLQKTAFTKDDVWKKNDFHDDFDTFFFITSSYSKSPASRAIITGGSDGIGKGYALELAKRGLNVCIISRTESKLQTTCKEITSKHPATKTEYICFDFLTDDYSELYQKLTSFEWFNDTGVLVNNVGVLPYGYDCYAKFGVKSSGLSVEETCREVENLENINLKSQKVNIHAPSMMTGFLLPVFVQKKKGVIVNLSSVSAVSETPYWTVYGAAKAYNYYRVEWELEWLSQSCENTKKRLNIKQLSTA